jgi:hypothetical protein
MPDYFSSHALGQALSTRGILPKNCGDVELLIPVDGVLQLQCKINVEAGDIPKIIDALKELAAGPTVDASVALTVVETERDAKEQDAFVSRLRGSLNGGADHA